MVIGSVVYSNSTFGTAGNSSEWNGNVFDLTPNTYTYGDGDIGTPGLEGSVNLASTVPVPAASWLMGAALSGLLITRRKGRRL
ncbi:MAG: VPLPA-CTERM sorting domain-containing protein [Pseudomonadales bacterium]